MTAMIPTTRHLQYAGGYIELGMVDEGSDKLEANNWDDRLKPLWFWRQSERKL